jgi:hypothetical protein
VTKVAATLRTSKILITMLYPAMSHAKYNAWPLTLDQVLLSSDSSRCREMATLMMSAAAMEIRGNVASYLRRCHDVYTMRRGIIDEDVWRTKGKYSIGIRIFDETTLRCMSTYMTRSSGLHHTLLLTWCKTIGTTRLREVSIFTWDSVSGRA